MVKGVRLRIFGYPLPPPKDPSNPTVSTSYQETTIGKVRKQRKTPSDRLMRCEETDWLWNKLGYTFALLQLLALGFTKLSIVYFYRRIFLVGRELKTPFSIATHILICFIVIWTIVFFFAFLFDCGTHFSEYWKSLEDLNAHCPTILVRQNSAVVLDAVADIVILVLPIPKVRPVHL